MEFCAMNMIALLVLTTLGNVTQKETICVVLPKLLRQARLSFLRDKTAHSFASKLCKLYTNRTQLQAVLALTLAVLTTLTNNGIK